jgi:TatD DNase family protein
MAVTSSQPLAQPPTLFDTHCHLDYIAAGEFGHEPDTCLHTVWQRAQAHGVRFAVNPSVNLPLWPRVLAVAEALEGVYAAVGIHPCEAAEEVVSYPHWLEALEAAAQHPKVVALGETGLDYYHTEGAKGSPEAQALQRDAFLKTLQLGVKLNLPTIVHCREAEEDTAATIAQVPQAQGVMHCFGGDAAFAERMVAEHGFYISFAGNVTFKKAVPLQEAAKAMPWEYLLVETDAPFLSPVPERGKPNEPYRVSHVAQYLAELRGVSVAYLAERTTENALRLFNRVT